MTNGICFKKIINIQKWVISIQSSNACRFPANAVVESRSSVWCNINRKILKKWPFWTISSHFFADCMNIFHKNQTVILRFLTCQKPNGIKSYNIKHKKIIFLFFCNFAKENPENLWLKNGHFLTLSGHFFAILIQNFQKTEFQTVILRFLMGLNLNWIKSYGIILVKTRISYSFL